ncbi:MAG: hypothetical protein J5689_00020 [Clostridia bacterium]|nr:hypothetical protein [Clostridia bacterium]
MENTQKKSKKKLWIALGSLAIVMIVGLSITVGVLAATTAQVQNTITVTYTARKVSAIVSGKYQVLNTAAVDFTTGVNDDQGTATIDESKEIVFTGAESQNTASGSFETVSSINLTSTNNSVTFTYVIKNTSETQDLTAQVTLPTGITNVTVGSGAAVDNSEAAVSVTPGTNHATDTFTVAHGATVTYTVTVSITNLALDASYTGTFVWDLS